MCLVYNIICSICTLTSIGCETRANSNSFLIDTQFFMRQVLGKLDGRVSITGRKLSGLRYTHDVLPATSDFDFQSVMSKL